MKLLSASFIALVLAGCAGSPVHTSSMSSVELRSVDAYTLCKAYTPRELYSPSYNVIAEVQRRGLDCRSVYTYTSMTPAVMAATDAYNSVYGGGTSSNQSSYRALPGYRTCVYKAGSMVWTETLQGICPVSALKGGIHGSLER